MEASKLAAKRERELDATDPFRIYWRELVVRVHGPSTGHRELSYAEWQYWAVGCVSGEVYNGGFHQYFHNSSGATYSSAVEGFKAMGALKSLLLLQRAKQMIFGFGDVPEDSCARRTILVAAESDSLWQRLEVLDKQFWEDPDHLAVLSESFAIRRNLVKVPGVNVT